MRSVSGLLLATGTVMALAGCGGSSSSTSTGGGAAFAVQAQAICSQVNGQVAALPAITTTTNLLTTGKKEISLSTAAIAKLKAVTAPDAKKAVYTAYVAGVTQETELLQQALSAIKAGDKAKTEQLLGQSKSLDASLQAKAKSLGLTACTANVQPGSAKSTSSSS